MSSRRKTSTECFYYIYFVFGATVPALDSTRGAAATGVRKD